MKVNFGAFHFHFPFYITFTPRSTVRMQDLQGLVMDSISQSEGGDSYVCDLCDKGFEQVGQLNRHKKVHGELISFICICMFTNCVCVCAFVHFFLYLYLTCAMILTNLADVLENAPNQHHFANLDEFEAHRLVLELHVSILLCMYVCMYVCMYKNI